MNGDLPKQGKDDQTHGGDQEVDTPMGDQGSHGVVDHDAERVGVGDQKQRGRAMLLLEHRGADLKDSGPNGELGAGVEHPDDDHEGEILVEIDRQIAKSRTKEAEGDEAFGIPFVSEDAADKLQNTVNQIECRHDGAGLRFGHNAFFHDECHRRGEALLGHGDKGEGGKQGDKYQDTRLGVI